MERVFRIVSECPFATKFKIRYEQMANGSTVLECGLYCQLTLQQSTRRLCRITQGPKLKSSQQQKIPKHY